MTSDFIEKQIALYKTLEPCYCSAVQAMVYFNANGLNHLLYNRHRPRNHKEKHYRAGLIDHITDVVGKARKATLEVFANPPSQLWILEWIEVEDAQKQKRKIKVILRKVGNGNIHFWSVMQKRDKNYSKRKNPNP